MTNRSGAENVPHTFSDEEMAWLGEHVKELRQSASGQRILYQSLVISFVIGLAAHVGGYVLLLSVAPSGLLGLLADLLHALGWSLWTGVVVTVFTQIVPELKRRQIKQALVDYEAQRDTSRVGNAPSSKDDGARMN